jgi:hypothetical protein
MHTKLTETQQSGYADLALGYARPGNANQFVYTAMKPFGESRIIPQVVRCKFNTADRRQIVLGANNFELGMERALRFSTDYLHG